ncbi:MAG: hypothetical protein H7259_03890, partial [Cytophagales bacterium]|nr:hypothetical protein [Cytophaga sp.]
MEKIIKTDNASLSEEQKEFYRRIEEIKRLQDELEKLSVQIPKAIQEYTRTIHPIAQKISHLEKLRLEAIDEYCNA